MSGITVDTYKLTQYASRIDAVNKRISNLDKRLDKLYTKVGLKGLFDLVQADALTGYSWRLLRCKTYLSQTSSDFENVERQLVKLDPENFKAPKMFDKVSDILQNAHTLRPNALLEDEAALMMSAMEIIKGAGGKGVEALKKEIRSIPDDIRSAGEILALIEEKYKDLPRDITFAVDVFVPETLKDAYTLTSGLIQGDLTFKEGWDITKNILSGNTKIALTMETLQYTFTTAQELDDEMMEEVMSQIKQGDFIGALGDATEGFVDGILGGSVLIMGNVAGDKIDGAIDDTPGVKYLNKFFKYSTGMLDMNDGEGYSVGGMVKKGGEMIFEGVDKATDYATDKLNEVTDIVTDGVKSGVKWVKGIFS